MVRTSSLLRWMAIGLLGLALSGAFGFAAQATAPSVYQVADPGGPGGNGG